MFLRFQNISICVAVTGEGVNRGAGLGLEIPVDYFFMETVGSQYGSKTPLRNLTDASMKKQANVPNKQLPNKFIVRVFNFPRKLSMSALESQFSNEMFTRFQKIASAIKVAAIQGVFYERLTVIRPVPREIVCYNKVPAIQHVHYRQVRLQTRMQIQLPIRFKCGQIN